MKESEEMRLKSTIYESTLSTADAVPLPQWGRQRGGGLAAKKEANPASLRSAAPSKGRGSRGHSLLPMEGGAPKGRRLDGESGMKKVGKCISSASFTRVPYPPLRGPPSPMGKAAKRGYRFSRIVRTNTRICGEKEYRWTKPSPRGEGGERSEPDRVLAV